jgi:hypothetical protein
MKTHVYLNPMSPDGTPGEVKEIQVSDEAPKYLEPAANDSASDLGNLRHQVLVARSALARAKARGKGVAQAQKALEDAQAAVGKLHYDHQQQRQRQKTGGDHPFAPAASSGTSQFMPVRDYSAEREGDLESPSEEMSEEQLTAQILAAVEALETAMSNGAPWSEMLRLEATLKGLRDQLENPSAPPKDTTAAPPRKSHIERPAPTQPTGQAAAPAVKTKDRAGWVRFLRAFDARQAKRVPGRASSAAHAQNVCCEGKYKCAKCQAKAAV